MLSYSKLRIAVLFDIKSAALDNHFLSRVPSHKCDAFMNTFEYMVSYANQNKIN